MGIHISLVILVGDTQNTGILESQWRAYNLLHNQICLPAKRIVKQGQGYSCNSIHTLPWRCGIGELFAFLEGRTC
jgi:hypothetical protein